jgi:hypothetical protein
MLESSYSNYFSGSLAPLKGLPNASQLDMNVSCLFMHEVKAFFFVLSIILFLSSSYDININMVNMKNYNISTKINRIIPNVNE